MLFTYESYAGLIDRILKEGYKITSYDQKEKTAHSVILRHDVDFSIEKAQRIAAIENELGVSSSFFFLLSSDFYNVFSSKSMDIINDIAEKGHDIGLHFDEVRYDCADGSSKIVDDILREVDIMSRMMGRNIDRVSMHRPSSNMLESDLIIPGVINTYSRFYYKEYKYLSDSRRVWREPVEKYISEHTYDRLQILVHPFWYNDKEISIAESLSDFVGNARIERYDTLNVNISDLKSIIPVERQI